MSIAALTAFSLVELLYHHEVALLMTGDDHLCNALTVVNDEVLGGEVDEYNTYLTPVVSIDSAWGVQYCQSVLQGQPTTGSHLCLITLGQCDMQACRNQATLHGMQRDWRIQIGT